MEKFGITNEDLAFLAEYTDAHLDDVNETIKQLEEYKTKMPKSLETVFDTTLEYLRVAGGALERASLDLSDVNFKMFSDKPIKGK